jgi:hypothetical protein
LQHKNKSLEAQLWADINPLAKAEPTFNSKPKNAFEAQMQAKDKKDYEAYQKKSDTEKFEESPIADIMLDGSLLKHFQR